METRTGTTTNIVAIGLSHNVIHISLLLGYVWLSCCNFGIKLSELVIVWGHTAVVWGVASSLSTIIALIVHRMAQKTAYWVLRSVVVRLLASGRWQQVGSWWKLLLLLILVESFIVTITLGWCCSLLLTLKRLLVIIKHFQTSIW